MSLSISSQRLTTSSSLPKTKNNWTGRKTNKRTKATLNMRSPTNFLSSIHNKMIQINQKMRENIRQKSST